MFLNQEATFSYQASSISWDLLKLQMTSNNDGDSQALWNVGKFQSISVFRLTVIDTGVESLTMDRLPDWRIKIFHCLLPQPKDTQISHWFPLDYPAQEIELSDMLLHVTLPWIYDLSTMKSVCITEKSQIRSMVYFLFIRREDANKTKTFLKKSLLPPSNGNENERLVCLLRLVRAGSQVY